MALAVCGAIDYPHYSRRATGYPAGFGLFILPVY